MAIEYTWGISKVDCKPTVGDKTNVVFRIYWFCEGQDTTDSNQAHKRKVDGVCVTVPTLSSSFIEYNNLTLQNMLDWCWTSGQVDREMIEKSVKARVERITSNTPAFISPPLPF